MLQRPGLAVGCTTLLGLQCAPLQSRLNEHKRRLEEAVAGLAASSRQVKPTSRAPCRLRTAWLCVGLRSPVEVAACLAAESRQGMPAGRVRPMMLAGDGARRWALARGLPAAASAKAAEQVLPDPT